MAFSQFSYSVTINIFYRFQFLIIGLTGRAAAFIDSGPLLLLLLLLLSSSCGAVVVPAACAAGASTRGRGPARVPTVQGLGELWISLEPSSPRGHVDVHLLRPRDLAGLAENLALSAQLGLAGDHRV